MKDYLDDFFSENNFDIHEPILNHEARFLQKLQTKKKKSSFSWQWMSIAASILLLISFNLGRFHQKKQYDLASVSSEMKETQNFFVATINQEIKEIEKYRTIDTESIIEDSLDRIEELEEAYDTFKLELKTQENESHIIQRMISNYQQRLSILENLLLRLEALKKPTKLNTQYNEVI